MNRLFGGKKRHLDQEAVGGGKQKRIKEDR